MVGYKKVALLAAQMAVMALNPDPLHKEDSHPNPFTPDRYRCKDCRKFGKNCPTHNGDMKPCSSFWKQ